MLGFPYGEAPAPPPHPGAGGGGAVGGQGMRRVMGSLALTGSLAALAGLGGCASAPPTETAVRGQAAAARAQVVPCSTTWLVLATVSKCGSGGLKFGVAAE